MKNRTPKRHTREEIGRALALLESGKTVTEVAREFAVSKSLVCHWRDHGGEPQSEQPGIKRNKRTEKFIIRCWNTITLAFKKLDSELRREKPVGVRDLALAVAVLRDKLAQAEQSMRSQAAPAPSGFEISEDTLLILKRHREAKVSTPPEKNPAEPGLGASRPERQNNVVLPEPEAGQSAQNRCEDAQIIKEKGN